jgi:hypothetical protein
MMDWRFSVASDLDIMLPRTHLHAAIPWRGQRSAVDYCAAI